MPPQRVPAVHDGALDDIGTAMDGGLPSTPYTRLFAGGSLDPA
ncbi:MULTISPECIES: hypothetical protein [Streptomyces]|uniref:Uncharacterized protein n=2 Tax=Streptomyces TaxID=1883 RepID=A0ABV9IMR8_9ACTN